MSHRGHGIALFFGGLDSALAILLVMQQDIDVQPVSFAVNQLWITWREANLGSGIDLRELQHETGLDYGN